ncbi:MAG: leucine--tRNA ligase [Gemmatimonadales bacterium]
MTAETLNDTYEPADVEAKWRARWDERKTNCVDLKGARKPYYNLMMYPYPSAEGLHVGNVFAFVGADIHGRFRRLQGWDVFEPLGFDAFGIHSENYALEVGTHPGRLIPANIENFRNQLRRIGLMVDWSHEVRTTDPAYYKWTQWIFLQLYKAGLAVRKRAPVNWCPDCKTVLANEQVIDGYCERHSETKVTQKFLEQWFFKITEYTERLLENLKVLDWSDSTRTMQINWIGRSEGADVNFTAVSGHEITVFTTRPDTLFGATYLVLAPEHPLVDELTTDEQRLKVTKYCRRAGELDIVSRRVGSKEKTGVFLGCYARNPATGESIPIWIADYVLMEYGTGAIMAVPAHDARDYEFAREHGLPVVQVVVREGEQVELPFTDNLLGVLQESGQFDRMRVSDAIPAITEWLGKEGYGKKRTQYRLHDWCISRQRYWGPPIPMIYCDKCGVVPVPESDLPVLLPEIADFQPDESGVSPLARHSEWYIVECPQCGAEGRRETDVSDTFLDSAWYFLRYPSSDRADVAFDPVLTEKWLPISSYIGGNEHAVLHLMYARFITMVLKDEGFTDFEEPFPRFRAHGTIVKDGAKMSKSRGNVVVPDAYLDRWGADTFRMYLMFLGPYQEGGDFRDEGIAGIKRFLGKVWLLVKQAGNGHSEPPREVLRKLHQTIRKVADDIENLRYNTAISALMEYVNLLRSQAENSRSNAGPELVEPIAVMISPFAPHFAEECWERLGHSDTVFNAGWPQFDEELAREDEIELVVQVNGKVRARLHVSAGAEKSDVVSTASANEVVKRFIGGRDVRKTVYVPDRLINFVV